MSEGTTRRDLLRSAAALVAIDAQPVRRHTLNEHEYRTLTRLAELIMPGAVEAGAPEYIDYLAGNNPEIAATYTTGLAWLDAHTKWWHSAKFVDATPAQQTEVLERIAYRKNDSAELGPGIRFFEWARKMVVDAYFTSRQGIDYLGYQGNTALAHFEVPEKVKAKL